MEDLDFLIECGYVKDNGRYWEITPEGDDVLSYNLNLYKKERANKIRSWSSISISVAALIVAILALVLK